MNVTPALIERFWKRVEKHEDGCWLWVGQLTTAGYGVIYLARPNQRALAHRVSYVIHRGSIPDGLDICHHCDNPPCIRPDHLFPGTAKDNMADCAAKGRTGHGPLKCGDLARGERNPSARLTDQKVLLMRHLYDTGQATQYELAHRFGVTQPNVYHVVRRHTWTHVT